MKTTELTFEEQAQRFARKYDITMIATFLKHDKHFTDDKNKRDIYEIVLTRPDRHPFKIIFGNSVNASGKYIIAKHLRESVGSYAINDKENKSFKNASRKINSYFIPKLGKNQDYWLNENYKKPSLYDVLACIQKYGVGTFDDFCSEFGYDTDSRKAEKIYHEVNAEYEKVKAFFNVSEMEELQEIQ